MRTPRLSEVFLLEADTSSPRFKRWFRNSKVVDDQGNPAVMYHGTTTPGDFDVFRMYNDLGHHFGTSRAANNRITMLSAHSGPDTLRTNDPRDYDEYKHSSRVMPVYLSIQNPLELPDLETWEPEGVVAALEGYPELNMPDDLVQRVMTAPDKRQKTEHLRTLLKRLGYDGIMYRNEIEDNDQTSWIVFEPWQIKSINNRGTWDHRRGSIME